MAAAAAASAAATVAWALLWSREWLFEGFRAALSSCFEGKGAGEGAKKELEACSGALSEERIASACGALVGELFGGVRAESDSPSTSTPVLGGLEDAGTSSVTGPVRVTFEDTSMEFGADSLFCGAGDAGAADRGLSPAWLSGLWVAGVEDEEVDKAPESFCVGRASAFVVRWASGEAGEAWGSDGSMHKEGRGAGSLARSEGGRGEPKGGELGGEGNNRRACKK